MDTADEPPLPVPAAGWRRRLGDAVPDATTVLLGSTLWGVLFGTACVASIYLRNQLIVLPLLPLVMLFYCGAAVGFAPGLMLAEILSGKAGRPTRFVIGTVILGLSTHTAIAAVFALQYRVYYAHWHASFPSVVWAYQFTFTSLGAAYQFTVDSLYIYQPLVFVLVPAAGIWFARRAH